MDDIEKREQRSYLKVRYTVTLIGSTLGKWTFRVEIHPDGGRVASNIFISPGFYGTDAEAHKAAVELAKLYIDRQLLSHNS